MLPKETARGFVTHALNTALKGDVHVHTAESTLADYTLKGRSPDGEEIRLGPEAKILTITLRIGSHDAWAAHKPGGN